MTVTIYEDKVKQQWSEYASEQTKTRQKQNEIESNSKIHLDSKNTFDHGLSLLYL